KYVVSSGYAYIKPNFAGTPSPGDSLRTENTHHRLQYVVIPLLVKYTLINHPKLSFIPGFGFAGNFLTSASIETEIAESSNREHMSIKKLDGTRKFNWSIVSQLTMKYQINKKVSIDLRPFFSYALSPITNNNDVETFPYNFGIGVGASYRF
ncbi:MAG TPA: hypothetical protein VGC95_04150, partial [Chitinophagaceae bacterium]